MKRFAVAVLAALWMAVPALGDAVTVGLLAGAGGLGDQSYNDMTYAGLGMAREAHRFRLIHEESGDSFESQRRALDRLIERGATVIVANGLGLHRLVIEYAPLHPRRHFLLNDYPLEGFPNVAATVFRQNEGAFLAGVLAGAMTRTGKVAFIGGVDLPTIHTFKVGFSAGVRHAAPKVTVESRFISGPGDFSGFCSPEKGFRTAEALYASGADIIFAAAGMTGNGVITAARQSGKFAIGVDADQDHMARGHVLTSMMKRLDHSTFNEVSKILTGRFTPGVTRYGLANGGVSLSPMRFTRHLIPETVLGLLRDTEEAIVAGELSVPLMDGRVEGGGCPQGGIVP